MCLKCAENCAECDSLQAFPGVVVVGWLESLPIALAVLAILVGCKIRQSVQGARGDLFAVCSRASMIRHAACARTTTIYSRAAVLRMQLSIVC